MPVPRLLSAVFGLLVPVTAAVLLAPSAADAAPHRRHPAAQVRTATYKVIAPAHRTHRMRAANDTHRHVAQAHRRSPTRRG